MTDNALSKQGGARVRVPPPLCFVAAILLGWFVPGLRFAGPSRWLGLAFLLAGVGIGFGAVRWFRKSGQDPTPWKPSPELIVQGPYLYTRNPMYVGMLLLTLGVALLAGRLWIAVLAPVALLAVHFTAVLPEERYLTAKFGQSYIDYIKRVRRYL